MESISNGLSNLYGQSASLGLFVVSLQVLSGFFFALLLILCGCYLYWMDDSNEFISITGIITEANCSESMMMTNTNGNQMKYYDCNLKIKYNVNNKNYVSTMNIKSMSSFSVNQSINIEVNKTDPTIIKYDTLNESYIGFCLSSLAFVLIGVYLLQYYVGSRFQLYAAAMGAQTVFSLF